MIHAVLLAEAPGSPVSAKIMPATVTPPEQGTVSRQDGLAAGRRVCEVLSHPRCATCHVGRDDLPMSRPEYAQTQPHGLTVPAGDSRNGAATPLCATCHVTATTLDSAPHAAPNAMVDWRLAPVEMMGFGQSSARICAQMSDPDRNGGRDRVQRAEHLRDDAAHGGFVAWGFDPGGGRQQRPRDLQSHIDDVLEWGAAGQPCPE